VVSDPIVYVNRTNATWGEVTNATTRLDVTFVVYNPKPYPIGMTEIGYEVSMNDVTVGDGTTGRSVVIPPGETRTVETTTRIRNENLDEWWVSHLERNQVSELRMAFFAHLDLRTTTVRVPLSGVTYTKTIETDIFGTKPDTAGTADDGDPETATEAPNDRPGAGTPNDENGDGAAGTDVSSATPDRTPTPIPSGGDDPPSDDRTSTPEPTRSPTPTSSPIRTPTLTPSDDGGLLGAYRPVSR
jgi:LEA14-like dessication related protein